MVYMLINAVQELSERNADLEKQVGEYEGFFSELRVEMDALRLEIQSLKDNEYH